MHSVVEEDFQVASCYSMPPTCYSTTIYFSMALTIQSFCQSQVPCKSIFDTHSRDMVLARAMVEIAVSVKVVRAKRVMGKAVRVEVYNQCPIYYTKSNQSRWNQKHSPPACSTVNVTRE